MLEMYNSNIRKKLKFVIHIEGNSEVKFLTIWTDGKAEVGTVREERREEKRRDSSQQFSTYFGWITLIFASNLYMFEGIVTPKTDKAVELCTTLL